MPIVYSTDNNSQNNCQVSPKRIGTMCVVVVTYNRRDFLAECLDALLKQVYPLEAIYLIDNASTDGTQEMLKEREYIRDICIAEGEPIESNSVIGMKSGGTLDKKVIIHYVRMHENTGGAGGFYEGVKRAYEKGYDWLWLMDDDAEPQKSTLCNLLSNIDESNKHKLYALASLKTDDSERLLKKYNTDCRLVKMSFTCCTFVGLLLSRQAISKVGFPERRFFIWGDDWEYCYRIEKECGGVFLDKQSIIGHKVSRGKATREILGWATYRPKLNNFWKNYYGYRNLVYAVKKHKNPYFFMVVIMLFIRRALGVLVFDSFKVLRIRMMICGVIDGWQGKIDRKLNISEWKNNFRVRY